VLYVFHSRLWGLVLGLIFVSFAQFMAILFYAFLTERIHSAPDFRVMARSMVFGLKAHAQSLTGVLHYKIDLFILAALLSTREVGYYSVAVGLASLIFFIPDSVGFVLLPRLTSFSDEDAHDFTAKVCRNTLFITGIPALGIMLFGKAAIRILYGAAYLPACDALYWLLPGIMAMCIYKILCRNFTSRNRQQMIIVAALTGLITNVGVNFMLIPRLGIAGAALASTISYSITSAVLLFFFLKESGDRLRDLLVVNQSDLLYALAVLKKRFPQKVVHV
jgi:O-antigen/teichoic acid export membrane protein